MLCPHWWVVTRRAGTAERDRILLRPACPGLVTSLVFSGSDPSLLGGHCAIVCFVFLLDNRANSQDVVVGCSKSSTIYFAQHSLLWRCLVSFTFWDLLVLICRLYCLVSLRFRARCQTNSGPFTFHRQHRVAIQ